jgi:peptidoglycan/xylan/chitin deacetylase (PgdA/CDA1 family)
MLLVLMYHRINKPELFYLHLKHLAQNYPVVLPGDALLSNKMSICLSFDDAYYDFYHFVFPVLVQLNIRAIVGVPVKYIVEKTSLDSSIRLSVPYDEAMADNAYLTKVPFCTWKELKEMAESGLVKIASHSYSHINLTDEKADLTTEIKASKEMIASRLSHGVDTFIYPFGRTNKKVHSFASKYYKYIMRIGSALNKNWHNSAGMIYRVNADEIIGAKNPLNGLHLFKLYFKYLSNILRGK